MERKRNLYRSGEWLAGLAGAVLGLVLGALVCLLCSGAAGHTDAPATTAASLSTPAPTTTVAVPTTTVTVPTTTVPLPTETTQPTQPPETSAGPQPIEHHVTPNHFRAEDFAYDENGYMACLAAEYWLGIDVSTHQRDIDWEQVADAGIQFAIIRIAYRGWGSAGNLREDGRAKDNISGALAAGLKIGVYIYSQAITVEEAIEEARLVLTLLDGQSLEMPIVFDWEQPSPDEARTKNMDSETLNECALAFCREIEEAGYTPMIYFNQKQAKYMYDLTRIQQAGYDFWVAMYSDALTFAHNVQMWQYTSSGSVPGIKGRVDMDLYFPNH